jgi:hypothetical protein
MSDSPKIPPEEPEIPTPTDADLLPLIHGQYRDGYAAGTLRADLAKTLRTDAERRWYEGRRVDAARRAEEEEAKQSQKNREEKGNSSTRPSLDDWWEPIDAINQQESAAHRVERVLLNQASS